MGIFDGVKLITQEEQAADLLRAQQQSFAFMNQNRLRSLYALRDRLKAQVEGMGSAGATASSLSLANVEDQIAKLGG